MKIKRPDSRLSLTLAMDIAFAIAGVLGALFPSHTISSLLPDWAVLVWGSFFFVGGLLCSIGVLFGQLPWRYVGLPLMVSASALYGTSLLIQAVRTEDGNYYLFVGALLLAMALGLADRWTAVARRLRFKERQ